VVEQSDALKGRDERDERDERDRLASPAGDVRALSLAVRHDLVEQARIVYPRWRVIHAEIGRCHALRRLAGGPAEPPCLMLVGPTGVGKSMLVGSYAQGYPPVVAADAAGERTVRPVLLAPIPTPATVKGLAVALLLALGDPFATRGTVVTMTDRLTRYLADCRVELLILDELQHFVDRASQRVLEDASNWLKLLLKTTRMACVLVGLEHEAELLLRANAQLGRLFGDPYALAPFAWDDDRPETIAEFRRALHEIERLLPLAEPSRLADRATARRLFAASGGTLGLLMALLRRAAHRALEEGRERLDAEVLEVAFAHRLAGRRRGVANPFAAPAAAGTAPLEGDDSALGERRPNGANRRGRAPTPARASWRDVV